MLSASILKRANAEKKMDQTQTNFTIRYWKLNRSWLYVQCSIKYIFQIKPSKRNKSKIDASIRTLGENLKFWGGGKMVCGGKGSKESKRMMFLMLVLERVGEIQICRICASCHLTEASSLEYWELDKCDPHSKLYLSLA